MGKKKTKSESEDKWLLDLNKDLLEAQRDIQKIIEKYLSIREDEKIRTYVAFTSNIFVDFFTEIIVPMVDFKGMDFNLDSTLEAFVENTQELIEKKKKIRKDINRYY